MKKSMFMSIIMLIILIPSVVFGFSDDIKNPTPTMPNQEIEGMTETILGVIQWSGYVIAFGMLMYIGIKYMMSAVDDRANMKQALIRWVVGAVLIISTVTIVDVCFSMFSNMDGSGEGSEVETEESADSPLIGG